MPTACTTTLWDSGLSAPADAAVVASSAMTCKPPAACGTCSRAPTTA
ncbi:hypothetical protein ACWFOB_23290 [Bacillus subtilis]